jgi:hypothetical protein
MHRSKLSQILIDCRTDDLAGAAAFWAGALGLERSPDDDDDRYVELRGDAGLRVLLQRVEWPSAYHLDIEADDVEAEVTRLEALGATRVRKVRTWWVMRAPTGHDFCVIRPQSAVFAEHTHAWE